MRETWYVLEDGSVADPRDVAPDDAGVLRNKVGVAVAMRGQAHSSRGVDADEERAKSERADADAEAAKASAAAAGAAKKAMAPEQPKAPYKTREAKAD